jgi:hypothetical protein
MVKASRDEVARSLEGNWRDDLLFELQQAVDSYDFAHQQMRDCDRQSGKSYGQPTVTPAGPDQSGEAAPAPTLEKKRRRSQKSGATSRPSN